MSKFSRTLHLHAGKAGKRATVPAAAPNAATVPATAPNAGTRPPGHPWVIDGIDYGPAIAAVHDLAAWALDLAARDVADWPEGQRRVRTARRFVLARLRGKHPRGVPMEDILFTAGLLARLFEAELRLPMSDVVEIFDRLGFPTEDVPLMPRTSSAARRPQDPPLAPITPLRPCPAFVQPAPVDICNGCASRGPRFRVAA